MIEISIHALLAESDTWARGSRVTYVISIHALLAESDVSLMLYDTSSLIFLSTLSLRRATLVGMLNSPHSKKFLSTLSLRRATSSSIKILAIHAAYFYPRSPCGERPAPPEKNIACSVFLSTLSLRRATPHKQNKRRHAPYFYPRSPCGERRQWRRSVKLFRQFLSTLSLRRATGCYTVT